MHILFEGKNNNEILMHFININMHLHVYLFQIFSRNICNNEQLTHWGWVMHIYVSKLSTIGSDNGCRLVGAKPLSEPILEYCQLEKTSVKT